MKKYIRFGEIPPNEKSINFIKLSFDDNSYFTYSIDHGDISVAYECVPADAFEPGVSVFDCHSDFLPVLPNLRQVRSLLGRINQICYVVTGDQVSTGQDGEPLIRHVKIVKKIEIEKKAILDYVLEILLKHFENSTFDESLIVDDLNIYEFAKCERVNKKTGQRISVYGDITGKKSDWVLAPVKTEYHWMGWIFSNPTDNFL